MKKTSPAITAITSLWLLTTLLGTGIHTLHAATAAHDWPMWNYDAGRTQMTPMPIPQDLHLQWVRHLPKPQPAWPLQFDDGDKLEFDLSYSPVVMGERIFVPSSTTDSLTAYSIIDGSELWSVAVDGPVRFAPAAADGRVYFISDDGHLYCVDAATGEHLWSYKAALNERLVLGNNRLISMWAARGGPVIKDGIVYFAAGVWPFMGTFLYALDAATGDTIWANTGSGTEWQRQPHGGAFSFGGISPQGYLAVSGDKLVVSGGRSTPAVVDRNTGKILYLDIFGKGVGGYQVQADDEFFYNHGARHQLSDGSRSGSGRLTNGALDAAASSIEDQLDSPAFNILAAHGRIFVTTRDGSLYCFAPEQKRQPTVWQRPGLEDAEIQRIISQANSDPTIEEIVSLLPRYSGFALMLGVEDETLPIKLALISDLHLVVIENDEQKIRRLRESLVAAGLYGKNVAVLPRDPATVDYPPYISSLIIVEDPATTGVEQQKVHDLLRPYGGKALFGAGNVISRDGPLPGAGQWTHQYADSGRSTVSWDEHVRLPLGVLWFGTEGHDNILPRHAVGPRPQVAGGRLVILGVETISARDVYTGHSQWEREFPGIGHPFTNLELEEQWQEGSSVYMTNIPGAAYIGSPYVTFADDTFLRYQGKIIRLDSATGETIGEYPLYPADYTVGPQDWGPVMICCDLIVTTTSPHQFDDSKLGWLESWNATSSANLVVMDRHTGEILWQHEADIGFRHNAIVIGDNKIFVIDGLSERALEFLARRGALPDQKSRVIAFDASSGKVLWENDSDVFGTYLAYSEEFDVLFESGSRDTRRPLPDEETRRAVARNGSNGEVLWSGSMQFPAAIHGQSLIPGRPGSVLDLLTGETVNRIHPVTGQEITDSYSKFYGCGALNASKHLLLFRSGAAGYADLENDGGTGNFGGFRSGCTASMIAADGILNAPDYTRTCTCSYPVQTSLGLIHMPDAEVWTSVNISRGSGPIRHVGINLGAPGNRRDSDGTMWVPYPRTGAPTPEIGVLVRSNEFGDTPVAIIRVASSSGDNAYDSLDGSPETAWTVSSGRSVTFNSNIRYHLSEPIQIGRMAVAWDGPKDTEFRIEARNRGEDSAWQVVYSESSEGPGAEMKIYEFDPVTADQLQIVFGSHGDDTTDSRGRPQPQQASVYEVRFDGLEFPAAHAYFMPKSVTRIHPLQVAATSGADWIGASAVKGINQVVVHDVNGGGELYDLTLVFAELENLTPGQRMFDIHVQGTPVIQGFDPAAQAGAAQTTVSISVPKVAIDDSLTIDLIPQPGSVAPPMINGVKLRVSQDSSQLAAN